MAPQHIKRRIRRFWYGSILRKTPVHFLHISKTGGTALQMALRNHLITKKYFLEFHHHRIQLTDIPPGEKIIIFLRDPVTRFVSAFNTRLREGRPRNNSPWTSREKAIFRQFSTPNELAMGLSSNDQKIRADAIAAMNDIVHVTSFQSDWFGGMDYLSSRMDDFLYIGRQETLSGDFETLKKDLGLAAHLQLPKGDFDTHRTPRGLDQILDKEAVNNIRKWYHKDDLLIRDLRKMAGSQPLELVKKL